MPDYKVELDVYNGPLDLLLFLIRRDEVDIYDIPIAQITEQYVAYVSLLENLDPNLAGDFLVMAATLMEIKSRMLLPRPPAAEHEEEDFSDPRLELVRQLLEYKKFKDAAHALGTAMEIQALKHPRRPVVPAFESGEMDLDEVQVWDLFEAFQKLLEATGKRNRQHEVLYDDTPIALHAIDILDSLERYGGRLAFQDLFEGRNKPQLIGLFLALLELIRQKRLRAVQGEAFGTIELQLLDATPIRVNEAEDYSSRLPVEDVEQPAEVENEAEADAERAEILFPTGDVAIEGRRATTGLDDDEAEEEYRDEDDDEFEKRLRLAAPDVEILNEPGEPAGEAPRDDVAEGEGSEDTEDMP